MDISKAVLERSSRDAVLTRRRFAGVWSTSETGQVVIEGRTADR